MPPLMVILNPAARGGKGGAVRARVEGELCAQGIPFSLWVTKGPGHARELAGGFSANGAGRVLVVGGDGTIHEVVNGVLDSGFPPPTLSVLPVGTGNDFFRMIGSPRPISSALGLLASGKVVFLDVGKVSFGSRQAWFVNLLGIGLDVEVLRRMKGFSSFSGLPQYLLSLLSALISFRSFSVQMGIGGEEGEISGQTILSGVTLGPSIGGGFLINPGASPFDGLLDLFFVEPLGLGKLLRYIPRVIRGTHEGIPEFHARKVRGTRIRRPDGEPFFFEMDGELMPEPVTALEVEVCPKALPVLVPGAGP